MNMKVYHNTGNAEDASEQAPATNAPLSAPASNESAPDFEQANTHNNTERAIEQGYQTKEQFIENGGNPDDYIDDPKTYLALKGTLKRLREQSKQLKNQQSDFEKRVNDLNQYHTQQLELTKAQLTTQRDQAITELDADKARQFQQQIDELTKQPAPASADPYQQLSPTLQEWNNDPKNDWFKKGGAKALYANNQFVHYKNQNYDDETALRLMESDIKREFPDINANRSNAPMPEGGSKPGAKAGLKVSMNSLTHEEMFAWKAFGHMYENEEHFLKTVADARQDEGK